MNKNYLACFLMACAGLSAACGSDAKNDYGVSVQSLEQIAPLQVTDYGSYQINLIITNNSATPISLHCSRLEGQAERTPHPTAVRREVRTNKDGDWKSTNMSIGSYLAGEDVTIESGGKIAIKVMINVKLKDVDAVYRIGLDIREKQGQRKKVIYSSPFEIK